MEFSRTLLSGHHLSHHLHEVDSDIQNTVDYTPSTTWFARSASTFIATMLSWDHEIATCKVAVTLVVATTIASEQGGEIVVVFCIAIPNASISARLVFEVFNGYWVYEKIICWLIAL
jgi:hypothetical protein